MPSLHLTLYALPMTLNEYRNTHHYSLNRAKKEWSELVYFECLAQKAKIVFTDPVEIAYTFYFKNRQHRDLDNLVTVAKFTQDAFVEMGILPDDDVQHIRAVRLVFGGYGQERVEVTVAEAKL